MKSLGDKLRELRELQDLSLRELAKKIGDVTAAHLSDIEFGRRHPSDDLLVKLASFFHVPLEELRTLDSRPPVEDMKRLVQSNPQFGFAFRKLVDEAAEKRVSPDDILRFVTERLDQEKKKK
ncbi:MAG: helix-turn-helix transcriptional regulator [Bryobacteraceae bacterium]